jgi:hypothetical protein
MRKSDLVQFVQERMRNCLVAGATGPHSLGVVVAKSCALK